MSGIDSLAPFKLTQGQQEAAQKLEAFLTDPTQKVFILKGFAGTGKTSLLKALAEYASEQGYVPVLMASTGRAAGILTEKTQRESATVHSSIYNMEDPVDFETRQKIIFSLKSGIFLKKTLFIVDESSLISNHDTSGGFLQYGSGRLLSDILTYIRQNKIVFVGDAAQLPPVGSNISPALDSQNFESYFGINPMESALEDVMRFSKDSGIYQNTNKLRLVIQGKVSPRDFRIRASTHPQEFTTYPLDSLMIESYAHLYRKNGPESLIFITFSNQKVNLLNKLARAQLNFRDHPLTKSELVVVAQNNHLHGLFNGDQLTVLDFEKNTVQRAGLNFRKVTLLRHDVNGARQISGYMIDEYLLANKPMLTPEQNKQLIQDFMIRMSKQNITPKKTPEHFKERLRNDPFLNALMLRYGYALTCHKAQGGEWKDVFIIIEPSLFHPGNAGMLYRWIYTALTRSAKHLHLLENPIIQ
ncbi:MAG: ATP-dependent DNA helicase [Bacteroidales bacterium]